MGPDIERESVSQTGLSDKEAKLDSSSGKNEPHIYQSNPKLEITDVEVLYSLDTDCDDDKLEPSQRKTSSGNSLLTYSKNCLESASQTEVSDIEFDSDSDSDYIEESDVEKSDIDYSLLFGNPELNRNKSLKEKYIIRDINLPGIFVRKLRKRTKASKAQAARKKDGNTRRYDNYHACLYCGKLIQHISTHSYMKSGSDKPEVKEIWRKADKSGTKPDFTTLRKIGDNKHNCKVLAEGIGEIILTRRPKKTLDISQFGPCLQCKQWLLLKNI